MKSANQRTLTINGGSSSIMVALLDAGDSLPTDSGGGIDRIGLPEASLRGERRAQTDNASRLVTAPMMQKSVKMSVPRNQYQETWFEEECPDQTSYGRTDRCAFQP